MLKSKKFATLSLLALLVFSSSVKAEFGEEENSGNVEKTFTIKGEKIYLKSYTGNAYCPTTYAFVNYKGKQLTDEFGTCSEGGYTSAKKVGNKIIITMNGYKYADFGDLESMSKKQRKAVEKEIDNELKKVYQYTYQNGKVTEKRIK